MSGFQVLYSRAVYGVLAVILFAALIAPQAQAVVINWSGSALVGDGTADISTAGTLVEAHNAGDAVAITAGGVLFDAAEPAPLGNIFTGFLAAPLTGDANFDTLLHTGSWNVGGVGGTSHVIDGLSIGTNYLLQYFVADNRTQADWANRTQIVDDGDGGVWPSGEYGFGYAYTGLFVATATEQTITLFGGNAIPNGSTSEQINAWQLREVAAVPLPAALPLLLTALCGLGFLARRWRQTA